MKIPRLLYFATLFFYFDFLIFLFFVFFFVSFFSLCEGTRQSFFSGGGDGGGGANSVASQFEIARLFSSSMFVF